MRVSLRNCMAGCLSLAILAVAVVGCSPADVSTVAAGVELEFPPIDQAELEAGLDSFQVVGALGIDSAAVLLEPYDEAPTPRGTVQGVITLPGRRPKAYEHTAHAFGFIRTTSPNDTVDTVPILQAGRIPADTSLRGERLRIVLDRMRVADYPGKGIHRVLFDFYAQNQAPHNLVDHLHFNATYRAQEGEQVGVIGFPVFVGLRVGQNGVAFKAFTINVENDSDKRFLDFLESDVVKTGLQLTTTAQPALAPLSNLALGITKSILGRNKNVPVQDFFMGLDFSPTATGARLAEGTFIAVQIPQQNDVIWNWDEWVYDRDKGEVVDKATRTKLIPYNYVQFAVTRYRAEPPAQ